MLQNKLQDVAGIRGTLIKFSRKRLLPDSPNQSRPAGVGQKGYIAQNGQIAPVP